MLDDAAVVILAAGQGTRMKSRLPKVLHRAGGKSLVKHRRSGDKLQVIAVVNFKGGSGKTLRCSICHGEGLKGLGDVPFLELRLLPGAGQLLGAELTQGVQQPVPGSFLA